MFNYLKKYPLSLLVIAIIVYLSFFKPPHISSFEAIPNLDKIVHICMYFGMSGMLWIEYLRSHKNTFNIKKVLFGAAVLPILFSGCVELLQEYCTSYRGGDWMDFTANSIGVTLASLLSYFILRPIFRNK